MAVRATESRSRLAKVLGVADSTLRAYAQEDGFPGVTKDNGKEQQFEVRAVVLWWLVNKASKSIRKSVNEQLASSLCVDADRSQEWSVKDERDQLDLRLKEAEVERRLGELVRIADIEEHLRQFAARLSDALESVESTTGQPVRGIVEPVFEGFFDELQKLGGKRP